MFNENRKRTQYFRDLFALLGGQKPDKRKNHHSGKDARKCVSEKNNLF